MPTVAERSFAPPREPAKLRILAIDGGGIRGLIPAMLLARLEELLAERSGPGSLAEAFELIAGTSTGGLIALGLATPGDGGRPAITAAEMIDLYSGPEARRIFSRRGLRGLPLIGRALDLAGPRYGSAGLREVLEERLGDAKLAEVLTEVLITSYDMKEREPRFFKRWRPSANEIRVVDAAIATSSAPTYFPAHPLGERALVDGGLFANNPTVAAIVEAMKRTEGPAIGPEDLLVVSLGTGEHEIGYGAAEVSRWGALGWILPKRGGSPLIEAMLDGQSDAADHWAHMLLNHEPGAQVTSSEQMGGGPRYFRYQVELDAALPLDGTGEGDIARLREAGEALVAAREPELVALADALAAQRPPA